MGLKQVSYKNVHILDKFWRPRMEINSKTTIPLLFDFLEKTNSIRNIELASQRKREGFTGPFWTDSDVYKAIEAASYSLAKMPNPALEARIDEIIAKVAAAQEPDGYINSYFQVVEPNARFTDLATKHELYTAGHLFEAAVAYYDATGKKTLLDVAIKMADHIDSVFGDAPGKRMGYPGHPEIELALIKLWRATGEVRYLNLAWFFISNRGERLLGASDKGPFDCTFYMDDVPIRDHDQIKGHAVRALYLLTGIASILNIKDDEALDRMLDRVWANAVGKRMYITGGMGPGGGIEGFTIDYDLPNLSAYQETCASIAMVMWSHAMGLIRARSTYFDVMERALYNGALAGISLDGSRFFYTNPLASKGNVRRSEWFECACCPPNIARLLASVGGYAFALGDNSIWVNLYIGSEVDVQIDDCPINMKVKTNYPWDGKVKIQLAPDKPTAFDLVLRIPGWCSQKPSLKINGIEEDPTPGENGYLAISREWSMGDTVELKLAMGIHRMESHPNVVNNHGCVALQRGPIVYCLEEIDQDMPMKLDDIYIPYDVRLRSNWRPDMLGGIVIIKGDGKAFLWDEDMDWLYQELDLGTDTTITAIPYYAWNNRQPCPMKVWIPYCKYHMEPEHE